MSENFTSFTNEIREEMVNRKFRLYHELIPSFDKMTKPLSDSLFNIDGLLSGIVATKKELQEKCEFGEDCENCAVQKEIVVQKVAEKATEEPAEPQNIDEIAAEKPKQVRIVALINEEEFRTIPKYQLGRFTIESLNEIIEKIEGFLLNKNKILTKSNRQLTRTDREMLDKWRELEEKSKKRLPSQLFFLESDIRALLQEKLRPSFIKCIPCLRHIRRIQEERCGPLTFYFPTGN